MVAIEESLTQTGLGELISHMSKEEVVAGFSRARSSIIDATPRREPKFQVE